MNITPLTDVVADWSYDLKARNLAAGTIRGYMTSVNGLTESLGNPAVTAVTSMAVRQYLVSLFDEDYEDSTVRLYYVKLCIFFKWATAEGYVESNPMLRVKPPVVSEKLGVPIISLGEMQRLLSHYCGTSFEDRRNSAMLRLLKDTGMRRAELASIELQDLDLSLQQVRVTGKGRKDRIVPFGDKATLALRRYLRMRNEHRYGSSTRLWVSRKAAYISGNSIERIVRDAGKSVGMPELHPHMFRHTFCHNWLSNGGQERDLMCLCGWTSTAMLDVYAKSLSKERAISAYSQIMRDDV